MNTRISRIARVGVGSIAATSVDFAAYMAMVEGIGLPYAVSAFLSAAFGAVTSFSISKFWAFGDRTPVQLAEVALYGMVSFTNALLVASAVHWLAVGMGVYHVVAKLTAALGAFIVWSYPAQSRLVFRRARRARLARLGQRDMVDRG